MNQVLGPLSTHVGDQNEVPDSWLQPDLDLTLVAIRGSEPVIKDLSLCLSLELSTADLSTAKVPATLVGIYRDGFPVSWINLNSAQLLRPFGK